MKISLLATFLVLFVSCCVAQRDTPYAALSEAISAAEAKAELVGNLISECAPRTISLTLRHLPLLGGRGGSRNQHCAQSVQL
jgi:hypothetical protein